MSSDFNNCYNALKAGDAKQVKNLLASGFDFTQSNGVNKTILFFCRGWEMTNIWLESNNELNPGYERFAMYLPCGIFNNALHAAVSADDIGKIRCLFHWGINANEPYQGTDFTNPIFLCKSVECSVLLKNAGCDLGALDSFGNTVLHRLALYDINPTSIDIAKTLIEFGVDPLIKNHKNETALHHASTIEMCKLLINNGLKIDDKDINGLMPVDILKSKNDPEIRAFIQEIELKLIVKNSKKLKNNKKEKVNKKFVSL